MYSPGPGLWSLVLGPFGPDLGPGPGPGLDKKIYLVVDGGGGWINPLQTLSQGHLLHKLIIHLLIRKLIQELSRS